MVSISLMWFATWNDAKQVLNEHNFDQHNRVNAGATVIFAVFILHQVINEAEIDDLVNFPKQVVLWDQLVERKEGYLIPSFVMVFPQHPRSPR